MSAPARNPVTDGNLTRAVFSLTVPMLVASVLQNVQSLIDLFWVGHLGPRAVAALAMSGTLLMMLFPVVMGLATGVVALVSRHVGARHPRQASVAAAQALLVAVLIGIGTGAAGLPAIGPLTSLFGVEAAVEQLARDYLRISLAGAVTVFVLFVGTSAQRGAGDAVGPMRIMLLTNIINIFLDPLLIYGGLGIPPLGVSGAALATVAAQLAGCVIVVVALVSGRSGLHLRPATWRWQPPVVKALFRIGMPSTLQMLARSLSAVVLMKIVAACGTAAIAAYGIGVRMHMILLMPAFAFGNAAATLVGQNLGARQPDRARRAAWVATWADILVMAASNALIFACAPWLVRAFNQDPVVLAYGTAMLRITIPFFLFVAFAIVLGRALQGAGDTVAPMVTTIIALWGVQVPLAVWLVRVLQPAVHGVYWAMAVTFALHGLMNIVWFRTGRWQLREVS